MGLKTITSEKALKALAEELGVRPDWHEPDEQGVTVEIRGVNFDNAGFWGAREEAALLSAVGKGAFAQLNSIEMYAIIYKDEKPVAEVNLAELFSWACGYKENEEGE